MQEAWIQLHCPDCEEQWEANPADLPAPSRELSCPHCGTSRRASEFPRTPRDFEILEEFHGGETDTGPVG